jgi:diphthine-ammonia ligase
MIPGKVGLLYSGGKDSTFAIERLRQSGFEVSCLITIFSENPFSYMLHTPNIKTTELSSKALGIPIVYGTTKGEKEEELEDIRGAVERAQNEFHFENLGCGGLSSNYQKSRVESIAEEIGLTSLAPLWGWDQRGYLRDLVNRNYNFIMTSVSSAGLDERWLGRNIDRHSLPEILRLSEKFHFNPAFEGGEAETLVLDCPLFREKRIKILKSRKEWNGNSGILSIEKAELVDKTKFLDSK